MGWRIWPSTTTRGTIPSFFLLATLFYVSIGQELAANEEGGHLVTTTRKAAAEATPQMWKALNELPEMRKAKELMTEAERVGLDEERMAKLEAELKAREDKFKAETGGDEEEEGEEEEKPSGGGMGGGGTHEVAPSAEGGGSEGKEEEEAMVKEEVEGKKEEEGKEAAEGKKTEERKKDEEEKKEGEGKKTEEGKAEGLTAFKLEEGPALKDGGQDGQNSTEIPAKEAEKEEEVVGDEKGAEMVPKEEEGGGGLTAVPFQQEALVTTQRPPSPGGVSSESAGIDDPFQRTASTPGGHENGEEQENEREVVQQTVHVHHHSGEERGEEEGKDEMRGGEGKNEEEEKKKEEEGKKEEEEKKEEKKEEKMKEEEGMKTEEEGKKKEEEGMKTEEEGKKKEEEGMKTEEEGKEEMKEGDGKNTSNEGERKEELAMPDKMVEANSTPSAPIHEETLVGEHGQGEEEEATKEDADIHHEVTTAAIGDGEDGTIGSLFGGHGQGDEEEAGRHGVTTATAIGDDGGTIGIDGILPIGHGSTMAPMEEARHGEEEGVPEEGKTETGEDATEGPQPNGPTAADHSSASPANSPSPVSEDTPPPATTEESAVIAGDKSVFEQQHEDDGATTERMPAPEKAHIQHMSHEGEPQDDKEEEAKEEVTGQQQATSIAGFNPTSTAHPTAANEGSEGFELITKEEEGDGKRPEEEEEGKGKEGEAMPAPAQEEETMRPMVALMSGGGGGGGEMPMTTGKMPEEEHGMDNEEGVRMTTMAKMVTDETDTPPQRGDLPSAETGHPILEEATTTMLVVVGAMTEEGGNEIHQNEASPPTMTAAMSAAELEAAKAKASRTPFGLRLTDIAWRPEFEDIQSGAGKKLRDQIVGDDLRTALGAALGPTNALLDVQLTGLRAPPPPSGRGLLVEGEMWTREEVTEPQAVISALEQAILAKDSQLGGNMVDTDQLSVAGQMSGASTGNNGVMAAGQQKQQQEAATNTGLVIGGAVVVGILLLVFAIFAVVVFGLNSRRRNCGTMKLGGKEEICMVENGGKGGRGIIPSNGGINGTDGAGGNGINLMSLRTTAGSNTPTLQNGNGQQRMGAPNGGGTPILLGGSQFSSPTSPPYSRP